LNVKEDYMSATQNQDLMTPEEAYDVLVAQVHAPVFFKKLAGVYGVVPQNAKQARDLLQMAGQLRNVHEAESTKEAAAKGDMVSQAKHDLDHVLTQYGYPPLPARSRTIVGQLYPLRRPCHPAPAPHQVFAVRDPLRHHGERAQDAQPHRRCSWHGRSLLRRRLLTRLIRLSFPGTPIYRKVGRGSFILKNTDTHVIIL
jgi:hypothetical protein